MSVVYSFVTVVYDVMMVTGEIEMCVVYNFVTIIYDVITVKSEIEVL